LGYGFFLFFSFFNLIYRDGYFNSFGKYLIYRDLSVEAAVMPASVN